MKNEETVISDNGIRKLTTMPGKQRGQILITRLFRERPVGVATISMSLDEFEKIRKTHNGGGKTA